MPRKFTPRKPAGVDAPTATGPEIIIKQPGASEPMEQPIPQGNKRRLSSTGDARKALAKSVIEPVDNVVLDPEKMAMLAFFEEPVTVHIHSSTNKQDEQVFEVIVNGKIELFRRNEKKTVKRLFVDRLARLKPTRYTQVDGVDAQGVKVIDHLPTTGLRYPFSVVEDRNPLGVSWLNAVLAEGG